jgi:enoyl-CoA hydratase/carnithine racemase
MSEHVRVSRGDGILAITLARPERRNAITVAMYEVLADAIGGAASDPEVRLITVRGEGPDFAAGNDLADFMSALPRGDDIPVMRLLRGLAANRKPLIAAVHGNAIGIGTTMLLHCDLVIAERSTRFSLPFVDLGLVPEAASSLLIPQLVGRRRAAAWLLLAEPFGAVEARELGVVSHIVEDGTSDEALESMTRKLLSKPAEALQLTQDLLKGTSSEADILDRMNAEGAHFTGRLQSQEVKDAITAFFQSRSKTDQTEP